MGIAGAAAVIVSQAGEPHVITAGLGTVLDSGDNDCSLLPETATSDF